MIAFHPNGSVQTKVNMCSCTECFQGDFIDCLLEPGTMMSSDQLDDEDSDNNSNDEEHKFEDDDISHVIMKHMSYRQIVFSMLYREALS